MGNNPTPPPPGKGRPAGSPNKATANARAAIAEFVEGNVKRLNGLLDTIEQENGAQAAWDCIVDVLEYHIPKLARTELVGDAKNPVFVEHDVTSKILSHIPLEALEKIASDDATE